MMDGALAGWCLRLHERLFPGGERLDPLHDTDCAGWTISAVNSAPSLRLHWSRRPVAYLADVNRGSATRP